MNALYYIVDTLTSLYLGVLVLRFIMQLVRTDFRNPFAEAIVKATNPMLLPLRRVLPPMGRIDTASVVAIILFATFKAAVLMLLVGGLTSNPLAWLFVVTRTLVIAVLWLYVIMIFFYGIAGFLMTGGYSPVYSLLADVCEPLLKRVRKIIPSRVGTLDLSFLWTIIALQALILLIGEVRF